MPTESAAVALPAGSAPGASSLAPAVALKCSTCGAASLGQLDGVIILGEQMERLCSTCAEDEAILHNCDEDDLESPLTLPRRVGRFGTAESSSRVIVIDLARLSNNCQPRSRESARPATPASPASSTSSLPSDTTEGNDPVTPTAPSDPVGIPARGASTVPDLSKSLPSGRAAPWATASLTPTPPAVPVSPASPTTLETERVPNPLLDIGRPKRRSTSRGCLFPGSVFRGTQRSGRCAYEVEITLVDVNFEDSTLSGYLSISHLTDSHPHLTTYFDGEIIGPKFGFVTGARFGATEVEDRRHWERFEQFLRPSTKADIVRPEMLLRDPLPDRSRGHTVPRDRDFCFLRIKEKFLVPDHHVRDISGASFAGFYYAMVDMSPCLQVDEAPASPVLMRTGLPRRQSSAGPRPDTPRRLSTSVITPVPEARRASVAASRPETPRRQSSARPVPSKEATLRGYYFHSLNQEPFQELSLTHVPSTSAGAFQLR